MTVVAAPPLPNGWTGKLWALQHGLRVVAARPNPPEYLLLTDADIGHAADTLSRLVRRAVHELAGWTE